MPVTRKRYLPSGAFKYPETASASTRVVVTRLSSSSWAHFFECGLPKVEVPARLTTTSWNIANGKNGCPTFF